MFFTVYIILEATKIDKSALLCKFSGSLFLTLFQVYFLTHILLIKEMV